MRSWQYGRTKRSEVRTKKTKGRYSPQIMWSGNLPEVRNNRQFQTMGPKSGHGWQVSTINSNLTNKICYFGKLFACGIWLHTRRGLQNFKWSDWRLFNFFHFLWAGITIMTRENVYLVRNAVGTIKIWWKLNVKENWGLAQTWSALLTAA